MFSQKCVTYYISTITSRTFPTHNRTPHPRSRHYIERLRKSYMSSLTLVKENTHNAHVRVNFTNAVLFLSAGFSLF